MVVVFHYLMVGDRRTETTKVACQVDMQASSAFCPLYILAVRNQVYTVSAAPFFMKDFGLWIFSRSLVRKGYNGSIDAAAVKFSPFASLNYHSEFSIDPSAGIRCADIFLFFAVDGDIPGDDLCSREAVMDFLNALNSEDGTRKIHAFTMTSGSVVATSKKLHELRGKHLTA